ncbi:hypothetical protein OEIGOIKO_06392 [Streptomyces chrestomyceticus JCM 4735]|uniref:Uncharacterized protein n=2 Tax=Streptomyces chrestomyceticus TaxID=68185 RepID=A0A7U9L028_9ACTN|nr:hypothetical protein OEIGOIKO_06392 [Streptomyces chrestomyceticus JCM 4735]
MSWRMSSRIAFCAASYESAGHGVLGGMTIPAKSCASVSLPDWIPRGAGLRVVRDVAALGVDVVWLGQPTGERVLRQLGGRSGAVIEDHRRPAGMCWLVPAGTAGGTRLPFWGDAGVGSALYVPGLEMRSERLWWRVRPEGGALVTSAVALRAAVIAVESAL